MVGADGRDSGMIRAKENRAQGPASDTSETENDVTSAGEQVMNHVHDPKYNP